MSSQLQIDASRTSHPLINGAMDEPVDRAGSEALGIPGLRSLWERTLGDPRVCIAILDGPVSLSHDCFRGANLTLVEPSMPQSGPATEHGTHVASVVFGQHESLVKGIAPRCRGLIIPIFEDSNDESVGPCTQLDLAHALYRAIDEGANVINVSGGQYTPSGNAHPMLADALRACVRNDILVVAAAGNDGCKCIHMPGASPRVLAVGAMKHSGEPLSFSNWGYGSQGILAPGESILGAMPDGSVASRDGTSFATPIASGIAALLMSLQLKHGLDRSAELTRSALLESAFGCEKSGESRDCERLLAGRLNVSEAVSMLGLDSSNITISNPVDSAHEEQQVDQNFHGETPRDISTEGTTVQCESGGISTTNDSSELYDTPRIRTEYSFSTTGESELRPLVPDNGNILSASCSCGGGVSQIVYALGKLSFDYGTRSRRVYFTNAIQQSTPGPTGSLPNIDDPSVLRDFLVSRSESEYTILEGRQFRNRASLSSITWTITIDDTPIYAIAPEGPFAFEIHDALTGFLVDQIEEQSERISVPGIISGKVRLYTGETVPVIHPDPRGMFAWKTSVLADAATDAGKSASKKERDETSEKARHDLEEFLNRVYDQTRNLGVSAQDRALNYAATDALRLQGVYQDANARFPGFELDSFSVEKSAICRDDSDCWDVVLYFYDPENLQRARRGFRFTVDVSDVVPVMIGKRKDFSIR